MPVVKIYSIIEDNIYKVIKMTFTFQLYLNDLSKVWGTISFFNWDIKTWEAWTKTSKSQYNSNVGNKWNRICVAGMREEWRYCDVQE